MLGVASKETIEFPISSPLHVTVPVITPVHVIVERTLIVITGLVHTSGICGIVCCAYTASRHSTPQKQSSKFIVKQIPVLINLSIKLLGKNLQIPFSLVIIGAMQSLVSGCNNSNSAQQVSLSTLKTRKTGYFLLYHNSLSHLLIKCYYML